MKPQEGTWTLTAPDGRQWQAESPLRCVRIEQLERIPATEQLRNIVDALQENAAQDASAYASGVKAGREEALAACAEMRRQARHEDRNHYDACTAAIRALRSPADSGMVMVPREPTEAMEKASGPQVGWIVFSDSSDISDAALYPMRETAEAHDAAHRWRAGIMAVYTSKDAPSVGTCPHAKESSNG